MNLKESNLDAPSHGTPWPGDPWIVWGIVLGVLVGFGATVLKTPSLESERHNDESILSKRKTRRAGEESGNPGRAQSQEKQAGVDAKTHEHGPERSTEVAATSTLEPSRGSSAHDGEPEPRKRCTDPMSQVLGRSWQNWPWPSGTRSATDRAF
jgi:hypothetical protein